jgi:hypothetical protein
LNSAYKDTGGAQLEISDGVGIVKAMLSREVMSELDLYSWKIKKHAVIVIRGVIFRQSAEDGEPSFIINECPRLVLPEVTGLIGAPIPFMKAIH